MSDLLDEIVRFRQNTSRENQGYLEGKLIEFLDPLITSLPLQNLKHRFQLGLLPVADIRYRNANHNRFDHTIGVMARCLVVCDMVNEQTEKYQSEPGFNSNLLSPLKIDETDALELCAAAALHDAAHLPVSHATERAILSVKGDTRGVRHEERIAPLLLLQEDKFFGRFRNIITNDWKLPQDSLVRIALLLGATSAREEALKKTGFIWPKRCMFQMLNSALDMDRLDFIIRDATMARYLPVLRMEKEIQRVPRGLFLVNTKMLGKQRLREPDVELCLSEGYLPEAFNMLVARVMLYKYVYFNESVRGLEGCLTSIVAELLRSGIYLELLSMITLGDEEFIEFIKQKVNLIIDETKRASLARLVEVLIGHSQYYNKLTSIRAKDIKNPRIRQEFLRGLASREYIQNVFNAVLENVLSQPIGGNIKNWEILLDPFILKTGGGDFLVYDFERRALKTLDDYMNGSNMHRICSESRLDIYTSRALSPDMVQAVSKSVNWFCNI
jgi:HD superfamily phosphohydrolase